VKLITVKKMGAMSQFLKEGKNGVCYKFTEMKMVSGFVHYVFN